VNPSEIDGKAIQSFSAYSPSTLYVTVFDNTVPETTIEAHLQEIEERLADVNRPPATTLDILGEAKRERYWENLLVYFLDPENPHGFGTDVLRVFLKALAEHEETVLPLQQSKLGEVKVQSQVPTGKGPFDIFLWSKDAWYVVIELKVAAAETRTQTKRYAQASKLGDLNVSRHDGTSEYVYLAPRSAGASTSETFVDVSWEHIVPYLEDVLTTSHGQYPSKSHAQLADYLDTIRQTLNMDDFTTISEETKLYTEYSDTIDRLVKAYKNDKAKIFNHLQTAFLDALDGPKKDWTVNNRPKTYINFAKINWENVAGNVRIEYEPHVHLNRDHPEIRLRLDIENSGNQQIREEFSEKLGQEDWEALEDADWEVVDGSYAYLAKSVPFDTEHPADSIRRTIQELNGLRAIVEPYIDGIVQEHQNSTH
jgi:hypothetical protein